MVIPAVEAGFQRGTLVMQPADNQFTRPGRRGDRGELQLGLKSRRIREGGGGNPLLMHKHDLPIAMRHCLCN